MNQLNLFGDEVKPSKPKEPKPWVDFTPPSADKVIQVLSYGGGVQTFALLVLVEQGRIPKPDLIIFADTGREKRQTYQHMRNYALPIVERLGVSYYSVRREVNGDDRDIWDYHYDQHLTPIWPTCTTEFKLRPIKRRLNELFDIKPGVHLFDSWIGISTDEAHRDSPSDVAYIRKVFPLLELGISREGCKAAILAAGYPVPPKSGCDICPHQKWEKLYTTDPETFQTGLTLETHAAERKPDVRLTEHGRGLRQIALQPKFKWVEYEDDACSTGYCQV